MFEQETIAAIATSSKNGSISVIRVSGENSFSIVSRIFCNEKGTLIDLNEKKSHTIQYGFIFDGSKKIDEVLVLLMKAPKSYTAEDVVNPVSWRSLYLSGDFEFVSSSWCKSCRTG